MADRIPSIFNDPTKSPLRLILEGLGGNPDFWKESQAQAGRGELPRGQLFPVKPEDSRATAVLKSINNAVANMPSTALTPFGYLFAGKDSPAPAGPLAPPAPTSPANVRPAQVPTRGPVQSPERSISIPIGVGLPEPPPQLPAAPKMELPPLSGAPITLPNAPQMTLPGKTDFGPYRKLLEGTKPNNSDVLTAVLGGLAGGTAQIDATKPGSFAQAVAAMGAGGSRGFQGVSQDFRQNAGRMAEAEFRIMEAQRAQQNEQNRVAFMNAEAVYNRDVKQQELQQNYDLQRRQQTIEQNKVDFANRSSQDERDIKNTQNQYEYSLKTREMQMPKVQHDANGITISRFNPETKSMEVKFTPTKSIMEQADKLGEYFKALNLSGQAAEAQQAIHVMNSMPDPTLKKEGLRRMAVERVVQNGAGQAVFGTAYQEAVKKATAMLQQENPTLTAKPDVYQVEVLKRASSILLSDPRINNDGWFRSAAPHSVAAAILAGVPMEGPAEPVPPLP